MQEQGKWSHELLRKWKTNAYTLFVLHGNIFDVFPTKLSEKYVSLKSYLTNDIFSDSQNIMFYDISDGLAFCSPLMQTKFFEWLSLYDETEKTNYHIKGPPKDFVSLSPILMRFFRYLADSEQGDADTILVIDFPEKIIPTSEGSSASNEERIALVSLLKWATSTSFRQLNIGVLLVTESASNIHADILRNPHVAQVAIDLPSQEDRLAFIEQAIDEDLSDISSNDLSYRTAGLSLLRIKHLVAECTSSNEKLTYQQIARSKKKLIEEYCQGLVKFKEPEADLNLTCVATHDAAKKKLTELAWLIKNGKYNVLERGVLLPGRIGVGKSYLVDCFASECGLPVMTLGDFRSKWVGDTEKQQSKILMTIKALGPVIVVVDEADSVFGNRSSDGDSGVSTRVFSAFAAHIGNSKLRGRELWIAMTSRPDLLAIDMKRQGRFGLCIPLFPAQDTDDIEELFFVISRVKGVLLSENILKYISRYMADNESLTGSEVDSIITRAKEIAVVAGRDDNITQEDIEMSVNSFIDPLDSNLIMLQELAAVLACSDKRFLPEKYLKEKREKLQRRFEDLKRLIRP